MTAKRIFITGASGCIGHYFTELLIQETDHELFLLVRNPAKLKFDYNARPGITVLEGDMMDIEQFGDLLKTIHIAILAANAWGGTAEVFDTNVAKTLRLINLLDPKVCEQVLYFSTASILNQKNQLLEEARQIGTDYIRSKYDMMTQLPRLEIAPKITVLFPTLVLGGDGNKPYSHISSGLKDIVKWVPLARWFRGDASFHFLHSQDIARVVVYLVDNPLPYDVVNELDDIYLKQVVLGNPATTVNDAVAEVCEYFGHRIYWRIPLTLWFANFIIVLFRIQMATWDRFCMNYRHFVYKNPVNPATFGLPVYCPTVADIFRVSGIPSRRRE
ncbi:NAD-dependent epimerase/dehydratase family protein [Spirulina subsalsa]|uniref:NAD-dependent epimerase/dehydratase family protein n=1 Tax=Spirulina subsalsa TaxID=54311 RepID=UPI00030476BC|nr:NAD(P)-dependent oxidoreductase [Spirulina subsalsa]